MIQAKLLSGVKTKGFSTQSQREEITSRFRSSTSRSSETEFSGRLEEASLKSEECMNYRGMIFAIRISSGDEEEVLKESIRNEQG